MRLYWDSYKNQELFILHQFTHANGTVTIHNCHQTEPFLAIIINNGYDFLENT